MLANAPAAKIFAVRIVQQEYKVDPNIDKKTAVQDEIFAWDRTVYNKRYIRFPD